jgi:plastocyanin
MELRRLMTLRPAVSAAALAVASQACGNGGTNPPDTTPAAIAIVSGDNQTAQVGTALANLLVVRVTNAAGAALGGVSVVWSVLAGNGTLASATNSTNAQGQAGNTYTVGGTAGANQVRAAVQGSATLTATFGATAAAVDNTPAVVTVVSGDNQSAFAGQPLASPLVVRVANAGNRALQDITVSWSVSPGGGTLGAGTSVTNAQGQASNTYTVGASPGANQVQAAVQGNAAVNTQFSASALDATPAVMSVVGGNNQSATVGATLANALVVRVANAANQALPNVLVSWTVVQGGGTLGAATSTTNAQGQAANSYTVGTVAGPNQVRAEVQANTAVNTLFDAVANAVAATASVDVTDFQFTPPSATVAAGGTVTWNFNQGTHNVTWVSGGFTDSGNRSSGTYQAQFSTAGTYQYYCSIHGSPGAGMHGSITVQ